MGDLTCLTGTTLPTPKGWISLADAFAEINFRYLNDDTRDSFSSCETAAEEAEDGLPSDGLEAVCSALWAIVGKVTRVGVLTHEGAVHRLEPLDDGPPLFLRPRPLIARNEPGIEARSRTRRSSNAYVSLSVGTVGSGDAVGHEKEEIEAQWGALFGRPVLLDAGQFEKAVSRVFGVSKRPNGRPEKQPYIKAAYEKRYPEGHKAAGHVWKEVQNNISPNVPFDFSETTLKRAVDQKK